MKRIAWCIAAILLCGGCSEYPNGTVVKRERFGGIFANFGMRLQGFQLANNSVHEYRFKRVRFHDGLAGVRFQFTSWSDVEFATLDTVATVEIWEVGNNDSLVYRQSGPLNDILSEDKPAWWPHAYDRQDPRTYFGGDEEFVAGAMARLSGWKEYRLKVVVTHPETNHALQGATASVELTSTSK